MTSRSVGWVTDTVAFTHLARAGHLDLLAKLSPGGILLVPDDVAREIDAGRSHHVGIPDIGTLPWVKLAVLTRDEEDEQLRIKANMGGTDTQHLGECAAIAVAKHRDLLAIMDDWHGTVQAEIAGVPTRNTLWLVVHGFIHLWNRDRDVAEDAVDDLLATGMKLPLKSGKEIFNHALEMGWLP